MRVLLIEDDAPIRDVVKRGLEEDRLVTVDTAADGDKGLRMALGNEHDVIILDLMLPGIDGWEICREVRSRRIATPILMLSARDAVRDRVHGLEIGADDYLPKPFDFDELLARVRALVRRDKVLKAGVLRIEYLEIDTFAQSVHCDGELVSLTAREYALLEALARNEGRVLTRDAIQNRVWNSDDSVSNTVDVYIGLLRKKVEGDREAKLIHTVHGLGYMLKRPTRKE